MIFNDFHGDVCNPLPSGNDCYILVANWNMAIEIVDLPINSMVDLSSSLCKRLPEGSGNPYQPIGTMARSLLMMLNWCTWRMICMIGL